MTLPSRPEGYPSFIAQLSVLELSPSDLEQPFSWSRNNNRPPTLIADFSNLNLGWPGELMRVY